MKFWQMNARRDHNKFSTRLDDGDDEHEPPFNDFFFLSFFSFAFSVTLDSRVQIDDD